MLAVRVEARVSSVPGCPALVGPGPTVCRVESVARWRGGRCQPSLAWVLKLASAHYSLRNVAAARYLGNHVTLRLVECAGAGRRGLRVRLRWCDRGEGLFHADSRVGDGQSEDECSLSVICQSLFNRMSCLDACRLNTHTHTHTHTHTLGSHAS